MLSCEQSICVLMVVGKKKKKIFIISLLLLLKNKCSIFIQVQAQWQMCANFILIGFYKNSFLSQQLNALQVCHPGK